jgi:hypothetical protein
MHLRYRGINVDFIYLGFERYENEITSGFMETGSDFFCTRKRMNQKYNFEKKSNFFTK